MTFLVHIMYLDVLFIESLIRLQGTYYGRVNTVSYAYLVQVFGCISNQLQTNQMKPENEDVMASIFMNVDSLLSASGAS